MLEFASLYLGLIWGLQPIEMVVGDPSVARLEFRLDGRRAAELAGPPWKTSIDFGSLAPHRLEVLGFGAAGEPLARAEQWVNVPREPAEARLVVEQDAAGRKTHAVLKWESVVGKPPISTEIRFDGVPLPVSDPARFPLPPADLDELHFLTALLVFPDGSTAHAEASFGGLFGDQVETELTAIPVRARKRNAALEPLFSCFKDRGGKSLRVAQVEKGAAEVLFVRDAGAEVLLLRLRSQMAVPPRSTRVGASPRTRQADHLRYDLTLEAEDRVRFVWPNLLEAEHPHFTKAAFFESSPFLTAKEGGLLFFLTRLYPEKKSGAQHLADALALAGLRASAEGRRRAAVLVVGDQRPQEQSTQTPAAVQGFLETLEVPLHLWAGASPTEAAREWAAAWPPVKTIGSIEQVRKAVRALEEDLESQRIAWIAGRHLASEIELDRQKCPDFAPLFPDPARSGQGM